MRGHPWQLQVIIKVITSTFGINYKVLLKKKYLYHKRVKHNKNPDVSDSLALKIVKNLKRVFIASGIHYSMLLSYNN